LSPCHLVTPSPCHPVAGGMRGCSIIFPDAHKNDLAFDLDFIDGKAITANGDAVARFQIEAVTVTTAEDLTAVGKRAFQRRVLVRTQAPNCEIPAVVKEQRALAAILSQRNDLARIDRNLSHFRNGVPGFPHAFLPSGQEKTALQITGC